MYELCRMSQKCHHRCSSLLPWKRNRDAHPPKLVLYSNAISLFSGTTSHLDALVIIRHTRTKSMSGEAKDDIVFLPNLPRGDWFLYLWLSYVHSLLGNDLLAFGIGMNINSVHLATNANMLWLPVLGIGQIQYCNCPVQLSDHCFVQCVALLDTSSGRFPLAPITNVIVAEYTLAGDRTGNIAIKQLETFES